MHSVCVLGLGLIGGSVLRAASAAGYPAWGATESTSDAEAAAASGYQIQSTVESALHRAAGEDALVVLAVPLPAVSGLLRTIDVLAPHCRLTDVVSVKGPVADAVQRLAPNTRYAGGHPMVGTAQFGWSAGSAELFRSAAWVVTADAETDIGTWTDTCRLALACGARVVPASAAAHDDAVARVSHLPHILAAVLAKVGTDGGELAMALAAGSFRDGTRVAGSRAELIRAMCEGNRGALLDAVDDALGRLGAARGSLASTGSLAATINTGHQARVEWERHLDRADHPQQVRIDLAAPEALATLRDFGHRGGHVSHLEGQVAIGTAPMASG